MDTMFAVTMTEGMAGREGGPALEVSAAIYTDVLSVAHTISKYSPRCMRCMKFHAATW